MAENSILPFFAELLRNAEALRPANQETQAAETSVESIVVDQTASSVGTDDIVEASASQVSPETCESVSAVPVVVVSENVESEDHSRVELPASAVSDDHERPQTEPRETVGGTSWFISMDMVPPAPPAPPEAALRPSAERQHSWEVDPLADEDPLPNSK